MKKLLNSKSASFGIFFLILDFLSDGDTLKTKPGQKAFVKSPKVEIINQTDKIISWIIKVKEDCKQSNRNDCVN